MRELCLLAGGFHALGGEIGALLGRALIALPVTVAGAAPAAVAHAVAAVRLAGVVAILHVGRRAHRRGQERGQTSLLVGRLRPAFAAGFPIAVLPLALGALE